MVECPACGSTAIARFRAPVMNKGVVYRRHRCLECRHIFLTAQLALSDDEDVTKAFEEKTEGRPLTIY